MPPRTPRHAIAQYALRLPAELYEHLRAEAEDLSTNQLIVKLLKRGSRFKKEGDTAGTARPMTNDQGAPDGRQRTE
jgi:hypothetical protein